MAILTDPRKLIRQPGSILQPKPGLLDAGGNQPKPVLQQPEQTSAITPKTQAVTAPSVPGATPTPPYQEAAAQNPQFAKPQTGFLTPEQATAGPYSGYTASGSSTGNANILKMIPQGPATAWTPEQWQQAFQESQGNPYLAGTTSAMGIQKIYNDYISKGLTPDAQAIGVNMGGMYLPDFKPSTTGLVKLQPGEQQTPQGVSRMPQITPAGQVPKTPSSFDMAVGLGQKTPGKPSLTPQTGGFTPGNANIMVPEKLPPSMGGTPGQTTGNAQNGDDSLSKIFKYFRGELEKERDVNLDRSRTEAASRGVFYGTPGTRPEEDVRDQFGRSLSQLESTLLQNEQQNELSRLGLASNLYGTLSSNDIQRQRLMADLIPQDMESAGGIDPSIIAVLGQLFGGRESAGGEQYDITDKVGTVPTVPPVKVQTPISKTITPRQQKAINKAKR